MYPQQNAPSTDLVSLYLIYSCACTLDNIFLVIWYSPLNLIENLRGENNKHLNEALLWAIFVLKEENIDTSKLQDASTIELLNTYLDKNKADFLSENSHYYKSIITRHKSIGHILGSLFNFDYTIFMKDEGFKNKIKGYRQSEKEAQLKLGELSSMRVQKPEPSLIPVEEITAELCGSRYLIRPSYQRQEKINVDKASAIMESIILGINLPPLFIFKRKSGVREVIDGQQRLLSILGFLGKNYQDETGSLVYAKNNSFKLKGLKILKEYNKKRYVDLDSAAKDKILDFKLSIIEIDEVLNANFDPVDLFIRLNNKPYPIKENSFEMWNSFIDKDIIQSLKNVTKENNDWFYMTKSDTSDRMMNEELITLLSYILYNTRHRPDYTSLGYYLRDTKISCRLTDKKDVSSLLEKISTDIVLKRTFLNCIKEITIFISTLKSKLDSNDYAKSLSELFNKGTAKRYLVDFYMLFQILQNLTKERLEAISYDDLQLKMSLIKDKIQTPDELESGDTQQNYFERMLSEIDIG